MYSKLAFALLLILILSSCSMTEKYLFPNQRKTGAQDEKFFQEKRVPEYNPGGERFFENQELFTQFMKDQKSAEEMENKFENQYKKNTQNSNLLDLYQKNRQKNNRFDKNIRDVYEDEEYAGLGEEKNFESRKKYKNNPDDFVIGGVDLKKLEGSYVLPGSTKLKRIDLQNLDGGVDEDEKSESQKIDEREKFEQALRETYSKDEVAEKKE